MPLKRQIGLWSAVFLGLGSMMGAGLYVSLALAAGLCGPAVVVAISVAGLLALSNGLSSAQLAAAHPVSGGTYAYGYRYLNGPLGFLAGWLFLLAKSASAATAALGMAGYLLQALERDGQTEQIVVALVGVAVFTIIVMVGIRASSRVNIVIVSLTLLTLVLFVLLAMEPARVNGPEHLQPFFHSEQGGDRAYLWNFLQGCALLFVAYTGYGRIATLGEEIRNPSRTIPAAIVITLIITMVIYAAIGYVSIAAVSTESFAESVDEQAAVLEVVTKQFAFGPAVRIVAAGAIAAMAGVLLNLILGLSRVVLAMGRQGDLPAGLAKIGPKSQMPRRAVLMSALIIIVLVVIGDVRVTWSFSAFCVLIYYGLTNICALRLNQSERRFPRWIAVLGLIGCFFLAFQVPVLIWLVGLGMVVCGFLWRFAIHRFRIRHV